MNKKRKVNAGFTLVELLATISILSLIVSIVMYTATGVMDDAKKKTYQVTKNNLVSAAGNYVIENPNLSSWTIKENDSTKEKQCVTVKSLVDAGYFKGDITESMVDTGSEIRALTYEDAVYLERDYKNKTIVSKEFPYEECNALGNVYFSVDPVGWGISKTVNITYTLNNKQGNGYKYTYYYSGTNTNISGNMDSNRVVIETIPLKTGGSLVATIIDGKGTVIGSNTIQISKIDGIPPDGLLNSYHNLNDKQLVKLILSDNESGVNSYYLVKVPDNSDITPSYENVANLNTVELNKLVDSAGTWRLGVKDLVGHEFTNDYSFVETMLTMDSGAKIKKSDDTLVSKLKVVDLVGSELILPEENEVIEDKYYTFNGWYDNPSKTGNSITKFKVGSTETIYGKVTRNVFNGDVTIVGTPKYKNTLSVNTSNISLSNDDNLNGVTYKYQWYSNTRNSNIGGTPISGATNKTYTIGSGIAGKYIYVTVTVSKDNYDTRTFTSPVTSMIQKADGYINLSTKSGSGTYGSIADKTIKVLSHHGGQISLIADAAIKYNIEKNYTITLSNLSNLNAGEYKITITSGTTNDYNAASADYILKINKATNTISVKAKTGLKYTGSSLQLVTTSNAKGTVYYSTEKSLNGNNYTDGKLAIPTALNAGSYTVYWYVTGNGNYNSAYGSVPVTVGRESGYINLSTTSGSITYGTSSKEIIVSSHHGGTLSVSSSNSTIKYNVSGNKITLSNLNNLNAGTYQITVISSATTNYLAKGTIYTLIISKAGNPIVVSAKSDLKYTGSAHQLVTTSNAKGTVYYSTSISLNSTNYTKGSTTMPTGIVARAYTVYWYVTGNTNYNSKSGSVSVTINRTNGYIYLSTTSGSITYGTSKKTFYISSHHGGVLSVKDNNSTASSNLSSIATGGGTGDAVILSNLNTINAGTDIKVTVTSALTPNYNSASETYTLTINKAKNPITVGANLGLEETGKTQQLITVKNAIGKVYYSTEENDSTCKNKNTSIPTKKDAGTYKVYWCAEGTTNYEAASGYVDVTIKEHIHEWKAFGKVIFKFSGFSNFDCGYQHDRGISIYCTKCQMSASYYEKTSGEDKATLYCPCHEKDEFYGSGSVFFDDSILGTTTKSDLNKASIGGGNFNGVYLDTFTNKDAIEEYCAQHNHYIKYNANGGTGAPSNQNIKAKPVKLSTQKPTRSGYTFKGWNTKADGTGTTYASGKEITYKGQDITLYAMWEDNREVNPVIINGKTLTYNGSLQQLVDISNMQGSVYYLISSDITLNSDNYKTYGSTSIPTEKLVGTYVIQWYAVGNTKYKPKSGSVQAKINPRIEGKKEDGFIYLSHVFGMTTSYNDPNDCDNGMTFQNNFQLRVYDQDHHGGTISARITQGQTGDVSVSIKKETDYTLITINNMYEPTNYELMITITSGSTTIYNEASTWFVLKRYGYEYTKSSFLGIKSCSSREKNAWTTADINSAINKYKNSSLYNNCQTWTDDSYSGLFKTYKETGHIACWRIKE